MSTRLKNLSEVLMWWQLNKGNGRVEATKKEVEDVIEIMPSRYSFRYLLSMGYIKRGVIEYYQLSDTGKALIARQHKRLQKREEK